MMLSLRALTLLSLFVSQASSFGGLGDPALIHHSFTTATTAVDTFLHHALSHTSPPVSASATHQQLMGPALDAAHHALNQYKHALATHPLQTKMLTGATLATAGDAIAQSKEEGDYDVRRASSFATFDMAYRALQHVSFPVIVEHCRGQFMTGALTAMFGLHVGQEVTNNFAAIEQTLASQLGIVPFLYYPVFFGLTGFIQGLSVEASVERAQEKFVPLMQRNLLFWLPVQFIQFGFIEESLQIPFLSVCGLAWTFILSIMAGSTKTYQSAETETDMAAASVNMEDTVVAYEETNANVYQEQLAVVAVEELGAAISDEEEEQAAYACTNSKEQLAFERQ